MPCPVPGHYRDRFVSSGRSTKGPDVLWTSHHLVDLLVATPLTSTHDSLEGRRTNAPKSLMVAPSSRLVTSQARGLVLAYLLASGALFLDVAANLEYRSRTRRRAAICSAMKQ